MKSGVKCGKQKDEENKWFWWNLDGCQRSAGTVPANKPDRTLRNKHKPGS